ncbi:MAG: sigma-70 family RNA polymerase sigma factor [Verrucomicrobiota bacterium]
MMSDDMTLVMEYAQSNSEQAFATLVSQHVNLVYSVALRQVHDPHLAEEITQAVFIVLAKKAKSLSPKTILSGWLCRTARNVSANTLKIQRRRQFREQESHMQSILNESDSDAWSQIAPLLDEALNCLGTKEHDAVVLRFFDGKELKHVGAAMGTTEDGARMRVNRGLEKLREFFTKRGVTLSATAIAGAVAANSVQAAPAGLAAAITSAALSGTAITTTTVTAATKAIAMTTLQKTIIVVTIAVLAGTGIYEARQAANARSEVQILEQQQTSFTEQIKQMRREHDDLTNRLAVLSDANRPQNPTAELLKLRNQTGMLRQQLADSSNAKAQSEQPPLSSAREYCERARRHDMNHEYEAELEDLNKAIAMDPNLAEAFFERGNLYAMNLPKTFGGYEKAVADLGGFLELKPNDCAARHNRALWCEQLRQFDNAIADYTTLIEGNTDFSQVGNKDKQLALEYHYRGRAYQWYKKDFAKAVVDYDQALRLDPNIEGVHLHRGQCYEALGQPDKAQGDFAVEKPN